MVAFAVNYCFLVYVYVASQSRSMGQSQGRRRPAGTGGDVDKRPSISPRRVTFLEPAKSTSTMLPPRQHTTSENVMSLQHPVPVPSPQAQLHQLAFNNLKPLAPSSVFLNSPMMTSSSELPALRRVAVWSSQSSQPSQLHQHLLQRRLPSHSLSTADTIPSSSAQSVIQFSHTGAPSTVRVVPSYSLSQSQSQ